jgi:hypothetical protein
MKRAAVSPDTFGIEPGDFAATLFVEASELPDYWLVHQLGTGDPSRWGALTQAKAIYRAGGYTRQQYKDSVSGLEGSIGIGLNTPRRAFMGLSEEAQFELLRVFEEWAVATMETSLGPAKYPGRHPVVGYTSRGQPLVRIPGIGVRFGRVG